jgi:molybdate transport system substrate-binding protein
MFPLLKKMCIAGLAVAGAAFAGADENDLFMKTHILTLMMAGLSICGWAELTVFAAASTTDVMNELGRQFEANGGGSIRFNFASSGALARQIDAGAPAEVYVSANTKWMDFLDEEGRLAEGTRADVVRNSLVLATPKDSSMTYKGFPGNLTGMLAVGDFQSVPAGTYAEAALTSLGWLDDVQGRLVKGASVRTVLMYIERGETAAGIVYRTDALQSDRVKVIGTFPPESHPPIVYPAACLKGSGDSAKAFLNFIRSSTGREIWMKYGFTPVEDD